ncbi:NTP transferase domain-containing protein [Micromonospora sp. R77]|uniref:sugar phosphate nucleotidyltransferase n=1 Tax=Micromonospora sp. R77 TaxID=2925836 RepID=UPI001F60D06E|nr:NTP transferase domain-containing protein [Micromonospora sp. R77]MCI4061862.1 NTP transferase domain-containing protein [Micromonospora sp. R77]
MVLAAGEGTRLRPLTARLPKALCPVGNVPLLDRALDRLAGLGLTGPERVAVNACYLGEQVVAHVGPRAHLSVEPGDPLGTAGGLGNLRDWIAGRGVLVGNADAYLADPQAPPGPDIAALLDGWDGRSVRLLGQPADDPAAPGTFAGHRFVGFSLLPWRLVRDLPATFGDLVRAVWRPAEAAGALAVVGYPGTFYDTGTPADYLAANLHAAGAGSLVEASATVTGRIRRSVVGAGATVAGEVTRTVVWPGATVGPGERLTDAVRAGVDLTVPARPDRRAGDGVTATTSSMSDDADERRNVP